MKLNPYRIYLILHALIVVAVILIFKFIEIRKIAALFAGTLFLLGPIYVLWNEGQMGLARKRISWWCSLIFLCFSALPIFILRIFYWSEDFENISLLGMGASQLHKVSNLIFMVMLLGFFIDSFLEKKKQINS